MHTLAERRTAVSKYFKYKRYSQVVRELGYPNVRTLRRWVEEYNKSGFLHEKYKINNRRSNNMFSVEQITKAIDYFNEHGRTISVTIKDLGYPSRNTLKKWLIERDENYKPKTYCFNRKSLVKLKHKEKVKVVTEALTKNSNIDVIAKNNNVSRRTVYNAIKQLAPNYGVYNMAKKKEAKSTCNKEVDKLVKEKAQLKKELEKTRIERDIYKKANELFNNKNSGIQFDFSNQEKTMILSSLKEKYKLSVLLKIINLSKSNYFYWIKLINTNKYSNLEKLIKKIFNDNYEAYGYRRIKIVLYNEYNLNVSEKVIRKIIIKLNLVIRTIKKKRYSSYKGEITPAAENIINRNFHADNKNQKWLTDITEFNIPAGKIYLSPIIDCFDGDVVSWSIGTSPNAQLVNSMLKSAINKQENISELIIHSDRGSHYRWPEWLKIVEKNGLIRSMSKKGCSPDNSACEGFFGILKNEMFYKRNWKNITIEQFIKKLNEYIIWYKEKRIKLSLGGLSPVQYRAKLGLV